MFAVAIALTVMFIYMIGYLLAAAGIIFGHILLLKFCVKLLGPLVGFILFCFIVKGIYITIVFFCL